MMTEETCAQMGQMMGAMMSGMSGGHMREGLDGAMMWGGMPWFGLVVLVVILAVGVVLTLTIIRRPAGDDSREILRRRFARGELSAEELAAALRTLG